MSNGVFHRPTDSPFEWSSEAFRAEEIRPSPRGRRIRCCRYTRTSLLATSQLLSICHQVIDAADKRISRPLSLPKTLRPFGVVTVKNRSLSPPAELLINSARAGRP